MSVWTAIQAVIRFPTAEARRARRAARVRQSPDRKLLAETYIPALARETRLILWVGCQAYTATDYTALEADGAVVWTMDIDPAAARWGHPQRHRTGDLTQAAGLFADQRFDAIVCNGVLGYGVNSPDQQRQALAAMAAIMTPGGRLLLGWNTDKIQSPVDQGLTAEWFTPAPFAGLPSHVPCPGTHVYDSLGRRSENLGG